MRKNRRNYTDHMRTVSLGVPYDEYKTLEKDLLKLEDVSLVAIGFHKGPQVIVYLRRENKATEAKIEEKLQNLRHIVKKDLPFRE